MRTRRKERRDAIARRQVAGRDARGRIAARIAGVIRKYGYDGATLSRLIEATGLRHASLYHYFPDGKQGMARAALDETGRWIKSHVLDALAGPGAPEVKLKAAAAALDRFYRGGRLPCLIAAVALSETQTALVSELRRAVDGLAAALAQTLVEAGVPGDEARRRAEDAVVRLQGALIVYRATDNAAVFHRFLDTLSELAKRPA